MNRVDQQTLLALAREAITGTLTHSDTPIYDRLKREDRPPPFFSHEAGCFVTIHTKEGALRGCIGNLWGRGPSIRRYQNWLGSLPSVILGFDP